MSTKLSLEEVNKLSTKEFHTIFINVVECWPEAAIYVSALLPFLSVESMINSFQKYLNQVSVECEYNVVSKEQICIL